jgi:hypothetical protein
MKVSLLVFVLIILFFCNSLSSQTFLRISYEGLTGTKVYEVFKDELFEFRLKGKNNYIKKKIVHMQDSIIVFDDNSVIFLSQLKNIRLRMHNHLVNTFQAAFLVAGIGFISLNTVNNIIAGETPVVDEQAVWISLALVGTSFLVRELGIKRIHLNDKKTLKIISIDYHHLNSK